MNKANTTLHQVESTASSSYSAHYHMTREPFGTTIEDDLYYSEPSRKQKLDILLHLTQYGNELVLIAGPTGSGKTTLLQQYIVKALDAWVVARIDAQGGIDERKLLQQLFRQMGMDFHGATHSELFERMQHHFDALQHSARQAVLLIDNAEQLPVTALKRVLEMAALTSADNKPLLRVILFGTQKLDGNFEDPLLDPQPEVVRRNVDLLPFSADQNTHYILHRLSAANFNADNPFTDVALQKIHKQSKGWPGEINQLAHNLLIETLPTDGDMLGNLPGFNKKRALAALAGVAILGAILFFQNEINTWFTSKPDDNIVALNTKPVPAANIQVTKTSAKISDSALEPGNLTKPEISSQNITADNIADSTTPESTESIMTDAPEPIVAQTDTTPTQPPETVADIPVTEKQSAPPQQPAPSVTVLTPATETSPIPNDLPGFRHAWILEQNPRHYTLQMVAGKNIKTLRGFIQEFPPTEPLAIYISTRKGKPWFGLIQHVYPSKQAAIDAREKLPAALRKQNPWVRRFADLQKGLK